MTHLETMKLLLSSLDSSMIEDFRQVEETCGRDIAAVAIDLGIHKRKGGEIAIVYCPRSTGMTFSDGIWQNDDTGDGMIACVSNIVPISDQEQLPDFTIMFKEGTPEFECAVAAFRATCL